jgi:hypothetical protein
MPERGRVSKPSGWPIAFQLYCDEAKVNPASPQWQTAMPHGPEGRSATGGLTFGTYFECIADFLAAGNGEALRQALAAVDPSLRADEGFGAVVVRAEKHGALYHPACVMVKAAGHVVPLVLNVAVSAAGQACLAPEIEALARVGQRLPPGAVPRVHAHGSGSCAAGVRLPMFLADWFEGFSEFHLAPHPTGGRLGIHCWESGATEPMLDSRETQELYRQVAYLLTRAFDPQTLAQIYPWHHAAGDFVLQRGPGGPVVKLISVRRYEPTIGLPGLGDPDSEAEARFLALLVFFLNLTVRIRIDRLEGTGELAWAGPEAVPATVAGFWEALPPELRTEGLRSIRGWTAEQLHDLLEAVAGFYSLMASEGALFARHLPGHARDLAAALGASP